MNSTPPEAKRFSIVRITLIVYLGLMVLVGLFTWPDILEDLESYGNSLLVAGIAVAILSAVGMGISSKGTESEISPLLRRREGLERLMARGTSDRAPYVSVILAGALLGATYITDRRISFGMSLTTGLRSIYNNNYKYIDGVVRNVYLQTFVQFSLSKDND